MIRWLLAAVAFGAIALALTMVMSHGRSTSPTAARVGAGEPAVSSLPMARDAGERQPFARRPLVVREDGSAEEPEAAPREDEAPVLPDREEVIAQLRAQESALLDAHSREPTDPVWRAESETRIAEELGRLESSALFEVRSVECRSSSCIAEVSWQDPEQVRIGQVDIVQNTFQDCERFAFIDPDRADQAPFEQKVFFSDCHARADRER